MPWELFIAPWMALWAAAFLLPRLLGAPAARAGAALSLPLIGVALLAAQAGATPAQRLIAASALCLYLFKAAVLLRQPHESARRMSLVGHALYMSLWPGMVPERWRCRHSSPQNQPGEAAGKALACFLLGLAGAVALAFATPQVSSALLGWGGLASLLLMIHFGWAQVMTALLRLAGWNAEPLFDRPEGSKTLYEFWSRRWNLPFVEMDRRLFMRPLVRALGGNRALVATFLISGLLHEMALSYPARGGWGGPLSYFAIQAALVAIERRLALRGTAWTMLGLLAPLPLLFHAPFRGRLIVPLYQELHATLASRPLDWYVSGLLWVMAAAQLLVLVASFQVPFALGWKEELPRLRPFNRKLMWVYGLFTVFTIVGFGVLTLALHDDLLSGRRAALWLAGFVSAFWTLRLVVDAVYFDAADWPAGAHYEAGHAFLNALFGFLAASYASVVVWHALA